MADAGYRYESSEVKITNINIEAQTVEFMENNLSKKTVKLFESVIIRGYHINAARTINLEKLELNEKYFIRMAYKDNPNKALSKIYVTFIGTIPYDSLY
jgi:hypothetical protein